MLRNGAAVAHLSWADRMRPFLVGLRFDAATACFLLMPAAIVIAVPRLLPLHSRRGRRAVFWYAMAVAGVGGYLQLAEFEFFREFQLRYNQLALEYLDQPGTVTAMVWHGYPVIRYTLVWAAGTAAAAVVVRWLIGRVLSGPASAPRLTRRDSLMEGGCLLLLIGLLVVGARGGLQHEPLRWGDAFKSDDDAANQLSLNGLYCLGRTVVDRLTRHDAADFWLGRMKPTEARSEARALLFDDDERPASSDPSADAENPTMLRTGRDHGGRWLRLKPGVTRPNVVIVVMESFSARMSASISGGYEGVGYTPEFDRIAKDGVLFARALSIGTHTHQGVFGTMLSFPNLPGYEALMASAAGNQQFTSLPSIFAAAGYQTLFLYNGSFDWDNMNGFFRKQGIDRFVGRESFAGAQTDGVWGVNDEEMLRRANDEFEAAAKRGPFFGLVLTLSNHSPFLLPDPLPFEPVTGHGEMDRRLNAVRYADWAFGRFVEGARQRAYSKNTVFVFVGDHGFSLEPKLTAANLLYHHVGMLVYGPDVVESAVARQDAEVSQLDVGPSVLGLLGMDVPRAFWGRDVFGEEGLRDSMAIFKSSSGDDVLAMARDDHVVVLDARGKAKLYAYDLGQNPSAAELAGPEAEAERDRMARSLMGVVQSAVTDLRHMRAGAAAGAMAGKNAGEGVSSELLRPGVASPSPAESTRSR